MLALASTGVKVGKVALLLSFLIFLGILLLNQKATLLNMSQIWTQKASISKLNADQKEGSVDNFNSKRQYILYFDVNGTIILTDPVQGKDFITAVNSELAERYYAKWENSNERLSYSDFIKKYKIDKRQFKDITSYKIAENRLKARFLEKLSQEASLSPHNIELNAIYEEASETYNAICSKMAFGKKFLFPSFIKLLSELNNRKINAKIVFRTFGEDLPLVLSNLNSELHTFIEVIGSGQFDSDFALHLSDSEKVLRGWANIYEYLLTLATNSEKIAAYGIVDNYKVWSQHGEKKEYGKPMIVSTNNDNVISYFFDDNIDKKEIMQTIELEAASSNNVHHLDAVAKPIHVDTVKALLDDDYYINLLRDIL